MLLDYSIEYSILCDRIDELYKVVEFERKSDLSRAFAEDFQKYLFLLAALDGDISVEEVNAINFILGTSWTGVEIKKYIETNNIYDEIFMKEVPESLKKIIELEAIIGSQQLFYFISKFYESTALLFSNDEKQDDFSEDYVMIFRKYNSAYRKGLGDKSNAYNR